MILSPSSQPSASAASCVGIHTYTFGSYALGGGKYVKVRTGKGSNTATSRYQGRSWYVWNNDKDTAYLYDASGTRLDSCSYNNPSASSVYC
jgi:hypothetical protein